MNFINDKIKVIKKLKEILRRNMFQLPLTLVNNNIFCLIPAFFTFYLKSV